MLITINADFISTMSAIVAVIAMLISVYQAHIARKAYRLSKEQEAQRKPNFEFSDILNCYVVNNISDDYVHFHFLVFCTNLSDKSMVVKNLTLTIMGDSSSIILQPVVNGANSPVGLSIPANQSVTEWIHFDLLREQYHSLKILNHVISIEDSFGNKREKAAIFIREEIIQDGE